MNTENAMTIADQKQLAAAESTQIAADMGIEPRDLRIPRLLLMANTSGAVGNNLARMGDIMETATDSVIGGLDKPPLEMIAIKLFKTHRVLDLSTAPPKFMRIDPIRTAADEAKPWEGTENGKPIRRDFTRNFYVLFVKDILAGEAFPYMISFTRSSAQAGNKIASRLVMLAALGKAPYSESFKIGVEKQKFETNAYGIFTYEKGAQQPPEVIATAKEWVERLKQLEKIDKITVDEDAAYIEKASHQATHAFSDLPEEAPF